ncbi:WRKY1 [Artemisia annua]|uniref:WRKY1 n=1 Tax=Artemisia annua TaxID=35608 RepID=A0A2U1MEP9_ARTAN|nr:WRKY1 [Artemisia annua]PWA84067.1 WRKY1 [Artemisia annua]
MNDNTGAIFSYPSSSSYLSLNMANNNHANDYAGFTEKDHGKYEMFDGVVVDDHVSRASNALAQGDGNELNVSSGKVNIRKGEKKIKKPKHAFQTRSQVDILDDGYRWRKYGQKAVKNNKFPRNYYRCTYQGCNVKKQVQRLSNDDGVVVTTYEGTHTHPIEKSTDNFENILTQMQIYSR